MLVANNEAVSLPVLQVTTGFVAGEMDDTYSINYQADQRLPIVRRAMNMMQSPAGALVKRPALQPYGLSVGTADDTLTYDDFVTTKLGAQATYNGAQYTQGFLGAATKLPDIIQSQYGSSINMRALATIRLTEVQGVKPYPVLDVFVTIAELNVPNVPSNLLNFNTYQAPVVAVQTNPILGTSGLYTNNIIANQLSIDYNTSALVFVAQLNASTILFMQPLGLYDIKYYAYQWQLNNGVVSYTSTELDILPVYLPPNGVQNALTTVPLGASGTFTFNNEILPGYYAIPVASIGSVAKVNIGDRIQTDNGGSGTVVNKDSNYIYLQATTPFPLIVPGTEFNATPTYIIYNANDVIVLQGFVPYPLCYPPVSGAIFQQRLWLLFADGTLIASAIGDFEDFTYLGSSGSDSDPIVLQLSPEYGRGLDLLSDKYLYIFFENKQLIIGQDFNSAITPTNVTVTPLSNMYAPDPSPVIVGNDCLFIDSGGYIRNFVYNAQTQQSYAQSINQHINVGQRFQANSTQPIYMSSINTKEFAGVVVFCENTIHLGTKTNSGMYGFTTLYAPITDSGEEQYSMVASMIASESSIILPNPQITNYDYYNDYTDSNQTVNQLATNSIGVYYQATGGGYLLPIEGWSHGDPTINSSSGFQNPYASNTTLTLQDWWNACEDPNTNISTTENYSWTNMVSDNSYWQITEFIELSNLLDPYYYGGGDMSLIGNPCTPFIPQLLIPPQTCAVGTPILDSINQPVSGCVMGKHIIIHNGYVLNLNRALDQIKLYKNNSRPQFGDLKNTLDWGIFGISQQPNGNNAPTNIQSTYYTLSTDTTGLQAISQTTAPIVPQFTLPQGSGMPINIRIELTPAFMRTSSEMLTDKTYHGIDICCSYVGADPLLISVFDYAPSKTLTFFAKTGDNGDDKSNSNVGTQYQSGDLQTTLPYPASLQSVNVMYDQPRIAPQLFIDNTSIGGEQQMRAPILVVKSINTTCFLSINFIDMKIYKTSS